MMLIFSQLLYENQTLWNWTQIGNCQNKVGCNKIIFKGNIFTLQNKHKHLSNPGTYNKFLPIPSLFKKHFGRLKSVIFIVKYIYIIWVLNIFIHLTLIYLKSSSDNSTIHFWKLSYFYSYQLVGNETRFLRENHLKIYFLELELKCFKTIFTSRAAERMFQEAPREEFALFLLFQILCSCWNLKKVIL